MPPSDLTTRRQQIAEMLVMGFWGFEELRRELAIPVGLLAEDLQHLEKSARRGGRKLEVEPATCAECGFAFRERVGKHLHPPSRCPKCKGERIAGPRFRLR